MKALRWLSLIGGMLLVFLGIYMLGTPVENLVAISFIISFSLVIYGVFTMIVYFSTDTALRPAWLLVIGILSTLLGLWISLSGNFIRITAFLPYIFSIWLVVSSISMAVGSIDLKNLGISGWMWQLIFGVIGTVLGFTLITAPVASALTLSYSVAFMFIYRGICDVVMFFAIKAITKNDED